ncbi:MAG: alpha/beta hydrolase [Actinobacteria bacterium]|nr:alpha/beta hydrolase [Actinomycetota bacterium]
MPTTVIDGITTAYEVVGSGPPLLLCSPGGFDAAMSKWRTQEIYRDTRILDHLAERYTCIVYDRRESGASGGRVEVVTWRHYIVEAKGLLDHLGFDRAHLMGGCMGCSPVIAFAVAHPERVRSMVLFWPVGGARYRIRGHQRFADHAAFAQEHGLSGVVELARSHDAGFGQDPRIGLWGQVLRHDDAFAEEYRHLDPAWYQDVLVEMVQGLLDRDTSPGAEPEDLLDLEVPALIVPGQDASHATSAARYLQECLSGSEYWDVRVPEQTEDTAPAQVLDFLERVGG